MNLFPCLEINAKDTQFINEIYSESTIDTRKDLMEWRYKIIRGFNEISLNNKKQKKAMTSMSDTDKYCLFWYN